MAAETPPIRFCEAGHGVCQCKGASAHPMAGSVGEIGRWGYLVDGRIVCSACVTKLLKGKSR